jgi:hypothetical protein
MDTITITVAENDPDVIASATLNEDAVTIVLNEAAVGATGPAGTNGTNGTNGAGVAAGGSANDILKKTSATNYATEWETPTSAATANTIVRRDILGGAEFGEIIAGALFTTSNTGAIFTTGTDASIFTNGTSASIYTTGASADISTENITASVKSTNFAAFYTSGASLKTSEGTAVLTWGAPAGNISITVNTTSTGHFFSNPSTSEAGHFVTKNGTTPTLAAGRSAWFSNASGAPQFKNGTGSAVTLTYDGGALGTPLTGTLTNCTGLPVSTGISGFGANVATFLATPSSANLIAAVTDATGDGDIVTNANPTINDIYLQESVNFNAESYTYGAGSAALHRAALGLTTLATTTPGTGVATALAVNVGTAGAFVVNGGAFGTPASGTLTSCTGLPISTGVSGLGTGVATLLTGTPSGTGGPVGTTSPTITTPTIAQINGGTAANDDLTLQGTTNATRTTSYVLLQPNGGFTGIGTSTPALPLHLVASNNSAGMFRAQNTATGGYTGFELYGDAGTQLAGFGTGNSSASFYPGEMYLGTNTAKAVRIYTTSASNVRMSILATGEVGIGTTTPSVKSVLDLTSTTKGFLPPRMTTVERDAITSVPAGLMIYNTTTNKLNVFTTAWEAVTSA